MVELQIFQGLSAPPKQLAHTRIPRPRLAERLVYQSAARSGHTPHWPQSDHEFMPSER